MPSFVCVSLCVRLDVFFPSNRPLCSGSLYRCPCADAPPSPYSTYVGVVSSALYCVDFLRKCETLSSCRFCVFAASNPLLLPARPFRAPPPADILFPSATPCNLTASYIPSEQIRLAPTLFYYFFLPCLSLLSAPTSTPSSFLLPSSLQFSILIDSSSSSFSGIMRSRSRWFCFYYCSS